MGSDTTYMECVSESLIAAAIAYRAEQIVLTQEGALSPLCN